MNNGVAWGNQYRMTTVCIDDYADGVLSGRLYNPIVEQGIVFRGVMDFLKKVEKLLDDMKFPQAFSENRVFQAPVEAVLNEPPGCVPKDGKVATFSLRILFRQNASWQGSATWVEGRQEESFRSVLELLLLMDSALAGDKNGG
jgi:hypothetical protein